MSLLQRLRIEPGIDGAISTSAFSLQFSTNSNSAVLTRALLIVSATKKPTNVIAVQTFTGTIRSDRRPGNCNPEAVRNVPAVK